MREFILTMLDSSGIQDYVFGSNRLQENIGASELVYRSTTLWAFEALDACNLPHNVKVKDWQQASWEIQEMPIEENEALGAEVVYAGGGNAMIILRNLADAQSFTKKLTRRILVDAPGLTITVRHQSFDWDSDGSLCKTRQLLLKQLAKHKQARLPSVPMLGLGVTAVCQSTGLVAVRNNQGEVKVQDEGRLLHLEGEEPRLISHETEKKIGWRDLAQTRLRSYLGREIIGNFDFPSDLDKLGRLMGEESYVAVVHADGNGMGKHIQNLDPEGKLSNSKFRKTLRAFSQNVESASQTALQRVIQQLVAAIDWNNKTHRFEVAESIPLASDKKTHYLPFRPLVFGGDDVTFVANGQLGLTLAAAYLQAFAKATAVLPNFPNMHACAGVAMVKVHYPFARAYQMSSQLTSSAKSLVRATSEDFSALDWHFALSGLSGSLETIRKREYLSTSEGKPLYMRPVSLQANAETNENGRYWQAGIERLIQTFQSDTYWSQRRNKVKGLRLPLRQGPAAVDTYLQNYELGLLPALLPSDSRHQKEGWDGERCLYFDAIELMDHYLALP